jgi:hypothetical protein
MTFSSEQLANWESYERVRRSGVINMFDARTGGMLSGLSHDEYFFCLKNYSELKAQYERESGETPK